MPRFNPSRVVPLPPHWPKRVRSAVIHAISLVHVSLTATYGWAADNCSARVRRRLEMERLRKKVALLEEEIRIKDARMLRIPAPRRPHYPPAERLAILKLQAACGWSLTQAGTRLLIATATVASWARRLDEQGQRAVVQLPEPVNKLPEFARYIVRQMQVFCPTLGKLKIAQVLCRAGLQLSSTTVRRILNEKPRRPPRTPAAKGPVKRGIRGTVQPITARHPDHVWLADFTTVPTSVGLCASWLPFGLPQRWPFCWWVTVVIDLYSRRIMGLAVLRKQPTSLAVRAFLGRVLQRVDAVPRHFVTDQGKQFRAAAFRQWCRQRGIRQRFGAIGHPGSIAVIERLIQTVKREGVHPLLVPFVRRSLRTELTLFSTWYNDMRPHSGLSAATPDEIYRGVEPAYMKPRFEPRTDPPGASSRATRHAGVRFRPCVRLELQVSYLAGRKHLPIVALRRAA